MDADPRCTGPLGTIAVVDEGGQPVLRLTGEIDSAVVAAYERSEPRCAEGARGPVVVDASAVTFLDGRGLRFLVRAAGPGSACRPVLRRPARIVRRVVELTGTSALFSISF
jgi:anti-anti-sigma factor